MKPVLAAALLLAALLLAAVPLFADAPPTEEDATRQFQATGQAPTILQGTTTRYPFGQVDPTVSCAPLVACDLELQAGETVLSVALGDSERWLTAELSSGPSGAVTPHVIVKPKEHGLATNLIIGTTRRTYHVNLVSPAPPRAQDPAVRYSGVVSWYYPADLVAVWNARDQAQAERERTADGSRLAALAVDPARLHTDYTLRNPKSVPWAPHSIFDDGEHVYLYFPANVKGFDTPVFLAKSPGGEALALNYRALDNGTTYVVDTLFTDAELAIGTGKSRQSVLIHRN